MQHVILNGEKSADVEVISDVPPGECYGTVDFHSIVNDLIDNIRSSMTLFVKNLGVGIRGDLKWNDHTK